MMCDSWFHTKKVAGWGIVLQSIVVDDEIYREDALVLAELYAERKREAFVAAGIGVGNIHPIEVTGHIIGYVFKVENQGDYMVTIKRGWVGITNYNDPINPMGPVPPPTIMKKAT